MRNKRDGISKITFFYQCYSNVIEVMILRTPFFVPNEKVKYGRDKWCTFESRIKHFVCSVEKLLPILWSRKISSVELDFVLRSYFLSGSSFFFFLDRMNEKERAPKEFENPVQISITCSKLPSFPYLYSILLLRIFKYYSSYRMVLRIWKLLRDRLTKYTLSRVNKNTDT